VSNMFAILVVIVVAACFYYWYSSIVVSSHLHRDEDDKRVTCEALKHLPKPPLKIFRKSPPSFSNGVNTRHTSSISQSEKNASIQYNRMKADLERHPDNEIGQYRGYNYELKRPYGTYWCGYIRLRDDQPELTDTQIDHLDSIVHGGLTSGIGFDCAHYNDYYRSQYEDDVYMTENATYKDYDFVYNEITKMIDYLNE